MKHRKLNPQSVRTIRKNFTLWFILIIAGSIGFYAGVELVMAHFGLLGEVDSMGKAIPVILSSLLMLPFGIGVAVFLMRYPMRPVKKLIHAMNQLAEGHFDERLNFGKTEQMKELADTFNTLASELQSTEMLRSDFVNNFSHEFKTPIVSIHGFATLLQQEPLTPQQHSYVDIIADESMRLASMSTNVLNLAKVENQSILADPQNYNLSEQLRKCILLLESKWENKNISFNAGFAEYTVCGDAELLQQVWVNLLDNAIKFSPEDAEIDVQIETHSSHIRVSISNHGPMIPPQDQKRLFDKFWQGDTSHASKGTGIGLSLVKTIVELHGGSVEVASTQEETVFSVVLPCI